MVRFGVVTLIISSSICTVQFCQLMWSVPAVVDFHTANSFVQKQNNFYSLFRREGEREKSLLDRRLGVGGGGITNPWLGSVL